MKSRSWLTSTTAPGVLGQESLQPLDRCQVEVVGRLVEEQQVGVLEQQPRERDAHHPAARELADVALHVGLGEAEAGQDAPRLGLQRPAAELLEPMLEPAVLVHQLGQLVLGRRPRSQLGLDVPHPALDAAHRAGAGQHLGQDAAPRRLGHLLAQVADGDVLGPA